MDIRKEIEQELNDIVPKLGAIEKKNPFKAPDYYFQSLPDKVLERIKQSPSWTMRLERLLDNFFTTIFQPRYAIPFAVCLVAVGAAVGFLKNEAQPVSDFHQQLSQISTHEISDYLLENANDDELMLLTASATEDYRITTGITSEELDSFLDNSIDNQTIKEDFL